MAEISASPDGSSPRRALPPLNSIPVGTAVITGEAQSTHRIGNIESAPEKSNPASPRSLTAPVRPPSPLAPLHPGRPSVSPHRARHPYMPSSSPGRHIPSSPRLHSPASSQIFERSVQEDLGLPQTSPAIPSHIVTENHIPPILDASSAALTDDRLDPDSVEIITHNHHQPASLVVTGGGLVDHPLSTSCHDETNFQRVADAEEPTPNNCAHHDTTDVRRLSFVSFADVVHGELAETADHLSAKDSNYMAGLSTLGARNRSPSPMHSPVSSIQGRGTSPPTSVSPESRGLDLSPHQKGRGPGSSSLGSHSPTAGVFGAGDLSVETMRQALRRTESGDLSAFRSQPLSAAGSGDGSYDRPF